MLSDNPQLSNKNVPVEMRKIYIEMKENDQLKYPNMPAEEFQILISTTLSAIDNTLERIDSSHTEPSFQDISEH
jgi:hypothetical protein